MADKNRKKEYYLAEGLRQKPYQYSFFHALRLIECCYDDKPLIGQSKRPDDEVIRFGQEVSMAFETSTLSQFIPSTDGKPARLNQRFLGLFGPNGPMPLHITEYVRNREHNFHDHTLVRFADIFHHRMICMFYRARANTEPTFSFDRPVEDHFSGYVAALAGFAGKSLEKRDAMPDLSKYYYTGYLSSQVKNADGLKAILADFLDLPVKLNEFIGEWLNIETSDLTLLGDSIKTGQLGVSAVLGSKVWCCQHKFRIIFGPLSQEQYFNLLPSGKHMQTLIAIVQNYVGYEYNWDINLVLRYQEVPLTRLDGRSQLGWCSWLGQRQTTRDAGDVLLNPLANN